jgi:hypothetical protein
LKFPVKEEYKEQAQRGEIYLCQHSIQKYFKPEMAEKIHTISPDHTKISTIQQLVNFLWDFDNESNRTRWDNAPFRILYRRVLEFYREIGKDEEEMASLDLYLKHNFVLTNWLIPYPGGGKFIQTQNKCWLFTGFYHLRLYKDRKLVGKSIGPESLWNRTSNRPKRYRHQQPDESKYMANWALVHDYQTFHMKCKPNDMKPKMLSYDGDLAEIGEGLEARWQTLQG